MTELPLSDARTAKERLEEIVECNDIIGYLILNKNRSEYTSIFGQCRAYEDGFEAVYDSSKAFLHVNGEENKSSFIVYYKI